MVGVRVIAMVEKSRRGTGVTRPSLPVLLGAPLVVLLVDG